MVTIDSKREMRKLSIAILGIVTYTMVSEAVNQYTTLLGYFNGFYENDPTARYLLSVSPALETLAVFAIPVALTLTLYLVWGKWKPTNPRRKRLQLALTFLILIPLIVLAISTTMAAISDYNTLHIYQIL